MTWHHDHDHAAATAAPPAPASGTPGKRTLTSRLPARRSPSPAAAAAETTPDEIEMTGVPLIDQGLFCDDQPSGSPGCPLTGSESGYLLFAIQTRALEYTTVVMSQIGRVRLELVTRRSAHWDVWSEAIFMAITTAMIGPLAGAVATASARTAVSVAVRGATKAAWALASVDPKRIAGALTMVSKMVRSSLAHRKDQPPTSQQEFLDYMETLAAPSASALLDGMAEQQLDQREMLELLARLSDPDIVGPAAVRDRLRTLVGQFELNRIGKIGDRRENIGDEAELAEPVWVRLRKQPYLVLCESFGANHLSLGLNGANLPPERMLGDAFTGAAPPPAPAPLTMASRTFVRIIEPAFHDLVLGEYRGKRNREPEHVNFDDPDQRHAARWFSAFYAATKQFQRAIPLLTISLFVVAFVIALVIGARALGDRDRLARRVQQLEASRAQACMAVETRLALGRSIAEQWLAGRDVHLEPDRNRLREDLMLITVQSSECLAQLPPATTGALDAMFAGTMTDDMLARGVLALDDALIRQAHLGWPLRTD